MIEHAWSVLVDRASIDKDTNNISLNAIEQIQLDVAPFPSDAPGILAPFPLEVVSLWFRGDSGEAARSRGRIVMVGPHLKEIGRTDIDIDLTAHPRLRTRARMVGLPLPLPNPSGRYLFVVRLLQGGDYRDVARIPLEVTVRELVDFPPPSPKTAA